MLFGGTEEAEMGADFRSGHRRAKGLTGKQLLTEFDWLERYIEALTLFTSRARLAMNRTNLKARLPIDERNALRDNYLDHSLSCVKTS